MAFFTTPRLFWPFMVSVSLWLIPFSSHVSKRGDGDGMPGLCRVLWVAAKLRRSIAKRLFKI